jgi:predicted regulator of Ras-like GTPase activity (Roadblock/LC7/MglB family)
MVYEALLNELCRSIGGAQGALLLDAGGEVVVGSEACDERLRLIGAYQGIVLSTALRTTGRYAGGAIDHLLARHASGTVIARPLKDGYYLVVALAPDAPVAMAQYRSAQIGARLNAEL